MQVSFLSVIAGVALGTIVGVTSGFKGGVVDMLAQRVIDTMLAFPQLVLLLVVVRVLGPSLQNVILVVALYMVPGTARVTRGAALTQRNNQYIEAARSVGASDLRILARHMVPNIVPLAIVLATTLLGTAILAEASLSFLGLGIPPPSASWGQDISAARGSFPINLWAALFPGLAISVTTLAFNLFGDTLRDILDPRRRGYS